MKRGIYSIVFTFVLSIGFAYAHPHQMHNLGSQDGLPDLLVNCIHCDDLGMMWLGTGSSVEMYDGIRLHHFPLPGQNGPQKRVTAIAGDPSKALWAGNGYGLWEHHIKTERFEACHPKEIVGGVRDLALDSTGVLYVATSLGLYTIEGDKVQLYQLSPSSGYSANEIRSITIDETGTLWIVSAEGLHAMLPNRQIVHFTGDTPEGGFTCLAARDGMVWLGTFHKGLYAFDIQAAAFRQEMKMIVPVSALQICENGELLIGTDGNGVLQYSTQRQQVTQRWTQTSEGESRLSSNSVYSVLRDQRGLLWVGFYQHGVDYTLWQADRLNAHKTDLFDSEGVTVRSLCIQGQQRLIGTRQGLYFIDKAAKRFRHFDERELDAQMIFDIHYWNGYYYIGTYGGGLHRLNPATLQLSAISQQLSVIGQQIFCLAEDEQGRLWVGSERGAFCMEQKNGTVRIAEQYTSRNSQLPTGHVYHLFFDQQRRGWICTAGGMALYDTQTQTVSTSVFPSSFPSRSIIRQVWQDSKGILYFVPDKGEMFAIDESWHSQPVPDIEGKDALFITEDGKEHLLIGTNNGLYYIKEDKTECLDFSDGLPSNIFTLCMPQTDAEGTVWLGNSRGLIYLKPDSIAIPQPKHQSIVTGIIANNMPLEGSVEAINSHNLRLPRGINNIMMQFSELSFTDPACMKYEYILEGHDKKWEQLTGISEHSWHNLRPGRYTLRVRYPDEPASEYTMRVVVPMSSEMMLFILTGLLLLVIITGVTLELRRRRKHRQEQLLQQQQEEAAKAEAEQKYKTTNIPKAELRKYKKELDALMLEEKLYLNPELKLSDLANRLNTSSFALSYLFNQHMGTSFYDYINDLRVEDFKMRVKNGEAKLYTLDALAARCGYHSRTSFFRNFKKATGMTPNEYISSK